MVKKHGEYKVSENKSKILVTLCNIHIILSVTYNEIVKLKRNKKKLRLNQCGRM